MLLTSFVSQGRSEPVQTLAFSSSLFLPVFLLKMCQWDQLMDHSSPTVSFHCRGGAFAEPFVADDSDMVKLVGEVQLQSFLLTASRKVILLGVADKRCTRRRVPTFLNHLGTSQNRGAFHSPSHQPLQRHLRFKMNSGMACIPCIRAQSVSELCSLMLQR